MGFRKPAVHLAAVVAVASLGTTPGAVKAREAGGVQGADQMMAGMMHDAEGGNGADLGPGLFAAADRNVDGAVTRAEFKAAFEQWFSDAAGGADAASEEQLLSGLKLPQPRLPLDSHLKSMLAALPDRAAAKPARPRKVLVLNKCAGFIHTPIPLTAKMIELFGNRTKAWSTTVTFDPADINEKNLRQYDALVLNSTTGAFLDDPNDPAASEARKKALIDFVRSGKGLVGIHGATDSYHQSSTAPPAGRGGRGGGGGGRGAGPTLTTQSLLNGDKDGDKKLTRSEMTALADAWYDKLDSGKTNAIRQAEFVHHVKAMITPPPAPPAAPRGEGPARGGEGGRGAPQGRDTQIGTWPDFNRMIGGFFKYHFSNQLITLKIDDPKSPLTAMFNGQPLELRGEIYTLSMDTWSRENLRVLTSVDYSKMSDADKAKESYPRSDHDYGMSWIRRDGKGRVFYAALGNEEKTFFIKPLNEHLLAGLQYALGDLKADDSPSTKAGTQ